MTHLITSGCSFTSHYRVNINRKEDEFLTDKPEFWYYTHWIKTLRPELTVFNMGSPGSGNLLIARSVIYKAKQLLKEGVSANEINIIIQWSSFWCSC